MRSSYRYVLAVVVALLTAVSLVPSAAASVRRRSSGRRVPVRRS
ncbi:hypothetical protein [Saccharopolyspora taberi]